MRRRRNWLKGSPKKNERRFKGDVYIKVQNSSKEGIILMWNVIRKQLLKMRLK